MLGREPCSVALMNRDPVSVLPNTTVQKAALLMRAENHFTESSRPRIREAEAAMLEAVVARMAADTVLAQAAQAA